MVLGRLPKFWQMLVRSVLNTLGLLPVILILVRYIILFVILGLILMLIFFCSGKNSGLIW